MVNSITERTNRHPCELIVCVYVLYSCVRFCLCVCVWLCLCVNACLCCEYAYAYVCVYVYLCMYICRYRQYVFPYFVCFLLIADPAARRPAHPSARHSVRTRNNRALAPPPPTGQSCLRPARRRHLWTEGELAHLLRSPSTTSSSLFCSEISTGLVYCGHFGRT